MGAGFAEETSWTDLEEIDNYYVSPSPAYPAPQAPPQKKRPWYKRIFRPITKRMSPPINQAKKFPKSPPKETQPLKDPLIRITQGIEYKELMLQPGFYLLHLNPGGETHEATLSVMQQSKQLFTLPAKSSSPHKQQPASSNGSSLPPPPHKKHNNASNSEVFARFQLAPDGRSAILIYNQGDDQYFSIPLKVTDRWSFQQRY